MKIAWFSPRVPARSDVANFTRRLEPELGRRFEARFLTEDTTGFAELANGAVYPVAPGHAPPGELLCALNEVDVPIYNLGNHADFFAHTWALSQCKPGIVILHDLKLFHLFDGVYRLRRRDQAQSLAALERHYGAAGREAGKLYWREKIHIDYMAKRFPMLGWAVRNALAVVVHTPHAREAVERQTGLATWLNALPYDPHASVEAAAARYLGPFSAQRPARLVVFGHLNANRRVTEFFQALATMAERDCFEVRVYGEFPEQYGAGVRGVAERSGLARQVSFHGYVSDEALDEGIARCDLAVNLRYPTMGEASGSLLRAWDHALPSLVTQIDAYADLPVETVCFVRPEHEREDVQRHLRDFLVRPEEFRELGEWGRRILLEHHRADVYVERLEALCGQVDELRSRHNRWQTAGRVGAGIEPWYESGSAQREGHHASLIAEVF